MVLTKGQDANSGDYHVVTTALLRAAPLRSCHFHSLILIPLRQKRIIVVTYNAVLNEKAVVSTGDNPNVTKLEYGNATKPRR